MEHLESMVGHLARRQTTPSLYAGISINEEERVVTFPLWNLMGQMVGFQQYKPDKEPSNTKSPDNRYYPVIPRPSNTAFGIDQISLQRSRILFVGEGVFDVCPLHNHAVNAIAVLCNDPIHLNGWIRSLGYFTVGLCDGDKAGSKLANLTDIAIHCPYGKDPGDMPDDFFLNLINQFVGCDSVKY